MQIRAELTGLRALLMHNVRLADPLDKVTQELAKLTSKRKKTEDDHALIADVEWRGGLYWDEGGAYIPTENLVACLREAATAWKLGESVRRAVIPIEAQVPLVYEGPKTLDALAKRPEFRLRKAVKNTGGGTIVRTRPRFLKWSLAFEVEVDESELSLEDFGRIAERAGRLVGLGDARKIGYGRFTVTVTA
jgi:hypothetical protein